VRGALLELAQLSGLRPEAMNPETQSDFEKGLAQLPLWRKPQLDPDDPSWETALTSVGGTRPIYFLLICSIPPRPDQGITSSYLGYALMLRYWPGEAAFRRIGIARVVLKDFISVQQADIHIL